MNRRTVLGLPAVGLVGAVVSSCGGDGSVPKAAAEGVRPVSYGDDPAQFGELSLPSGTPRGVVVVIHGGFWKAAYDLSLGRPLAADLVDRGWATWNIEYRRVGAGGGAGPTTEDVAAAVAKLTDFDLDLSTVVTLGHSAGGHLAAWVASESDLVTHVISQAGVLDLRAASAEGLGGGAVEGLLGHAPGPADDGYDPMQQVPLGVPLWCVHGTGDDTVPISQSRSYVEAATAAGARAELVEVEGDHYVVIEPGSEAWARTVAILDDL